MRKAGSCLWLPSGLVVLVAISGCKGIIIDPPQESDPVVQASCVQGPLPGPSAAVRLSDRQFRNTVEALFPFPVDVGTKYPTSSRSEEFTTSQTANQVLFQDIQSFADTAESIALQAAAGLDQMLPCTPDGDGTACAQQFIDAFVPRAYRRPIDPAERDVLLGLYADARAGADPLDFKLAMAAVIAAVLQSPQFLYPLEVGAPAPGGMRRLTSYEVASRLSYLYWDGPPDEQLMTRARAGDLLSRATVEAEAARMLDDPRARDTVWRFFSEWLGFGNQIYDSRMDPALAADFAEEAKRFVLDATLDTPGTLTGLLDNDVTMVNRRLARHYGVPYDGAGDADWRPVTLPAGQKAGVLAKAQVAAAHSAVAETSVVRRGKFIHERFICFDLGTPPPGAQAMSPVLPVDATPRDRAAARKAISTCAGCHQYLDDTGLGMDDLDAFGHLRASYPSGQPVDPSGVLHALPGGDQSFVGTAGLARVLASSPAVADCLARQWYRYATGHRETEPETQCHVASIGKRFADSGYSLRALLLSMASTDAFAYRKGGTSP